MFALLWIELALALFFPSLSAHAALFEALLPRDDSVLSCSELAFAVSFCNSVTPGFSTLPPSLMAPCFCYSSTSFRPDLFDSAVEECLDYFSTADPADYSTVRALEGFCTSVGDVLATPTAPGSFPSSMPPSPVQTPRVSSAASTGVGLPITAPPSIPTLLPVACTVLENVLSTCNILFPGFSTFASTDQAPCLCYSYTSWMPDPFDNVVKTCGEYLSTADPSAYTAAGFQSVAGFCTNVGDIRNSPVASTPSTTSLGTTTSTRNAGTTGGGTTSQRPVVNTLPAPTTVASRATFLAPALKMALVPVLLSTLLLLV